MTEFGLPLLVMHMTPRVRARVLRLNPNHDPGSLLRGYTPKPMSWRHVKKRLQRGGWSPMGPFKKPDGTIQWGMRPIRLDEARRIGWLK